ncbi:hypothetical protein LI216_12410 [Mediterraneibacter glycyrrhizinilyticus]|uniref:hypothetical protein n=1 Tax=Mediterraneibacter glycyrrhizinilyticus TaxID=342942 RepID=UPI001D09339F|nr:hypothetical protein [Mediterraneibacter glycyrrhizinilyticus]MCB6310368.1 hypothetical protein [Lachnospiraceae bacterium 210521-DFI.1.109]MCB6427868.1 hypothetical protein [Mediterraneibacter glycyrrhizinilyticus]
MEYPILEQAKIRLRQFHMEEDSDRIIFDELEENPTLEQLIRQAKADVKRNRHYPDRYTEEMIEKDLEKFTSTIVDLALYDYGKEGGEFQTSSSENGTSRNWINRNEILGEVTPFVHIL